MHAGEQACRYAGSHTCMRACMHDSKHADMPACIHACMQACLDAWMDACLPTRMTACMPTCRIADMHACKHACMYACMHVCMYAWTHAPTISLGSQQNIGLHTGARANVVLLTYLLHAYLHSCMTAGRPACLSVWLHACMHGSMDACLHAYLTYFRMLAQSYTPNLYTPPPYHNFFSILLPLFFAIVSIPIRFEPRIHPPVEWEHRETKTFTRKTSQPIGNLFVCPGPGLNEFRIKRKESDWLFCKEAELSQKVKGKLKNDFLSCVFRFYLYLFTAQVHACRDRNRQG